MKPARLYVPCCLLALLIIQGDAASTQAASEGATPSLGVRLEGLQSIAVPPANCALPVTRSCCDRTFTGCPFAGETGPEPCLNIHAFYYLW